MSFMNGLSGLADGIGLLAKSAMKDAAFPTRPIINSTAAAADADPVAADPAAPAAKPVAAATAVQQQGQAAADDLAAVTRAIYGQESGGGKNTTTSVTGAKGGMQIQPGTFAQYAKPGESIDNPADNLAVGQRIIADLFNRSGGDPARVAVGYFSGPGNIASADSATPWKRNAADPTGKSVSSYVADVLKRMEA